MFMKGTRVCWLNETKDGLNHGTVERGGAKKITVIQDGGEFSVSGPPTAFRRSDKPLPVEPPNPMDKYALKGYKVCHGHDDSEPFTATILYEGEPILITSNDGLGGPNTYKPAKKVSGTEYHRLQDKFFEDAKAWAKQFEYEDCIESEALWIEWYQHKRPYAVTAQQYLSDSRYDVIKL